MSMTSKSWKVLQKKIEDESSGRLGRVHDDWGCSEEVRCNFCQEDNERKKLAERTGPPKPRQVGLQALQTLQESSWSVLRTHNSPGVFLAKFCEQGLKGRERALVGCNERRARAQSLEKWREFHYVHFPSYSFTANIKDRFYFFGYARLRSR